MLLLMIRRFVVSQYSSKLQAIAEKKQKLIQEEVELVEKRKKEIGHLAEKFGLLTMPDVLINGLFFEAQSALKEKSEKIKTWESHGERFITLKRNAKTIEESTA